MPRDDFNLKTIELLARRVGYRCSNPHCRQPTSGPQVNPSKAVNIGVAAHITAASEGGPRYDRFLTPDERKSPENGIWLCWNCSKLIDNDEERFSVFVLLQWKKAAEEVARQEIEHPNSGRNPHLKQESYINNINNNVSNNVNQFYRVEHHHIHNYGPQKPSTRARRSTATHASKRNEVETRLYSFVVKPIHSAYPAVFIFLGFIAIMSFLSVVLKSDPSAILPFLVFLCIFIPLTLLLAYMFMYRRIQESDFYTSLSVDERRKVKLKLQNRRWENWWVEHYMYWVIQFLVQVDKRTADKIAKSLWS